ncbi:hypothetical protein AVEN_163357-1 [Araneus ventricosus]|uniref:Uncharacterized protein n=1 Tax=Araneus ventricosus TaxID=182803 RepID=A0A4Y2N7D7_ARAVE|nr:hypothetical protein AVEN_178242-1 [Araneus ventricosus]GBN34530.1 hypothetical protein AVEN_163357-1 [Araneus ventricosus]
MQIKTSEREEKKIEGIEHMLKGWQIKNSKKLTNEEKSGFKQILKGMQIEDSEKLKSNIIYEIILEEEDRLREDLVSYAMEYECL